MAAKQVKMPEEMHGLVERHMGLARSIAFKIYREATHALELDDLTSVALGGLVEAAARWPAYCLRNEYDPTAFQFFIAYSAPRIRGAVIDYLRAKDWATRSLREKSKKIREAGQAEGASVEILAERTDLSVKEVNDTLSAMARPPVSLESLVAPGSRSADSDDLHLEIPDQFAEVEATLNVSLLLESFVSAIKKLPKESQIILALHYYSGIELKKIAKMLDLTEAYVSSRHVSSTSEVLSLLKTEALGRIMEE